MKKLKNIFSLLVVALVGLSLTACSNDDLGTNQYQGGVSLNAYGPNPVMRGGQLRFVGSNLDQIASITIPGVGEITNIEVVKSGVPSEIRITVPKDGPQVGYVTLKTKTDQTITTKTQIEYIEGIEITQIPEETVMPGQTIRIEGDYLNLIYSMAFADGVLVSSDDFVAQDRYYIDVVVPEDAKTGKLEFYTADLTIQRTAKEEEELTYQTIVSEDALTVGLPTTSKIASPRGEAEVEGSITAKAGEQIKLTGTYYNVVSDVTVGGVSVKDLAVAEDGTGITFTLPAEAPSGEIMLICKSGEEVPVGTLETVKPSNCTATPSPVKAGATLTIAGNDMDLVSYVAFPLNEKGYTDVTEGLDVSAEKVTLKVPDTAVEGKLALVMANIKDSVFVEYTLVKPVATSYDKNPVSAGEVLTITGTDLDLVKSVTFDKSTAELEEDAVSADGTTLSVKVPMDAAAGKPKLNLANGTSEEAPELGIDEAKFCYATKLPGDEDEVKAGNSMTITVANGDKLTTVKINSTECQWILTGDDKNQVIIGIPEDAKAKSVLTLISSNGQISYDIKIIPATSVNKVVWTGLVQLSWNDGGRVIIPASAFESAPAGTVMTFAYSQVNEQWDQAQFNYGDWSGINFTEGTEEYSEENPHAMFNQTFVPTNYYGWTFANRETKVILTQEILNNIQSKKGDAEDKTDCGIIIQGSGLTFSKVTLSWEISLETDLATLVKNMDGTDISYPYSFTWGDDGRFSLTAATLSSVDAQAGSKLYFYKDINETGQIQINDSSWSTIETLADWNKEKDVLEYELTAADVAGGLVIQGAISGISKMTILP